MLSLNMFSSKALLLFSIILLVSGCATYDWQKANELNSLQAYQDFLKKHPRSKYKHEAKTKVRHMVSQLNWQKAYNINTIEGYYNFLKTKPTIEFRNKAILEIDRFEKHVWKIIREAKTVSIYPRALDSSKFNIRWLNENNIASLLELANLKLSNPEGDITILIRYSASATGAYWSSKRWATSGGEWYYSGARVKGDICIGNKTHAACIDFYHSSTDLVMKSHIAILKKKAEDAPFGIAFLAAEVPQKLVYLLSLGKGKHWTHQVNNETIGWNKPLLTQIIISNASSEFLKLGSYSQDIAEAKVSEGEWKISYQSGLKNIMR